jgi:hypothetical protein
LLNKALSAQYTYVSENEFFELKEKFDQMNGPDYNLLNGRYYEVLNSGTSHPYFNTNRYRPGSLLLNGEAYDSITINYDIFDQQVILQHSGISGQITQVVLKRELIDRFTIDGLTFRHMSFPETGSSFFQVVSTGEISCFLRWEKTMTRSTVSGYTSYRYSKPSREVYVQSEGRLYAVRTSSSFASLFDEAYRKEIQEYLRREKIRFRNASDAELGALMNFCTGLMHSR